MRMVLLLPLLMACSDVRIVVGHETNGCVDYDPDNPPAEALVVEASGTSMLVYRDGVEETCDSLFEPELDLNGNRVIVREYWSEGFADCSVCFNPTLVISDPEPGAYEVEWYVGDNSVPFDNVGFEVD